MTIDYGAAQARANEQMPGKTLKWLALVGVVVAAGAGALVAVNHLAVTSGVAAGAGLIPPPLAPPTPTP
jgi:hypothetical protein